MQIACKLSVCVNAYVFGKGGCRWPASCQGVYMLMFLARVDADGLQVVRVYKCLCFWQGWMDADGLQVVRVYTCLCFWQGWMQMACKLSGCINAYVFGKGGWMQIACKLSGCINAYVFGKGGCRWPASCQGV